MHEDGHPLSTSAWGFIDEVVGAVSGCLVLAAPARRREGASARITLRPRAGFLRPT